MKKKIIISICILFVFLISAFFIANISNNSKVDLLSMDNNQENTEDLKQIEYIEVELNNNNCKFSLNEQTQTIQIKEYTGIEDCVVIPEKINGQDVENIDVESFSDCYNLETIKIPIKLSEKIENIPDFEVVETTEEYAIYNTTREYSEAYKEYLNLSNEQKVNIGVIPNKFDVPISKMYTPEMEKLYGISTLQTEELPSNYDLRDYIDIEVESQLGYGICYAYASLSSVETNLSLTKNETIDFSEIHAGTMTYGYNGAFFNSSSNYYKNKLGPVYEEDFSMEEIYGASLRENSDANHILIDKYLKDESGTVLSSEEIEKIKEYVGEKTAVKYIANTTNFSTISASMKKDSSYEEEIELIRNAVKKHIMQYGSIATSINIDASAEYNGYTVLNNNQTDSSNHGVSIIGWDDSFSKENFPEECRPSTDGAYLVLNSYGISWGDSGCFWISYEDNCVETNLIGVTEVKEITENILSSSMEVIDIDKNETILNSKIKRSDNINVQININLEISNLLENKEVAVIVRNSKQDVTDIMKIEGKEIVNNQANLKFIFDTKQLEAGQYIIEIAYGDELITKSFKILQDFSYDFNDNGTITITKYNGTSKEVIVPNEYEGYKVTAIGDEAFYYNLNLESITLSDGITSIGNNAFSYCDNLEIVNLPNTLTKICSYAFSYCSSLSYINIPKSVTTIEDLVFGWCKNLEKVIIYKETTNIGYIFYETPKVVVYGEENSAALDIMGCENYEVLEYYDVTYITEDSDTVMNMPENTIKVEYENFTVENKIPTRDGFEFLGWALTEYSDEIVYNPGQIYNNNEDLTLYAVWKDNRDVIRVDVFSEYDFEDATYIYDGTERNITATGKTYRKNMINVEYFIEVNDGGVLTGGKAINAGVYTIIAKYSFKDAYKDTYGFLNGVRTRKATLTIEKLTLDMSGISFESTEEYIYDGTEKKVEISGQLPEGVSVEYENNIAINAGEHKAIAKFKYVDTLNYNLIENMETILSIKKAEGKIEITNKDQLSKIYDGIAVTEPIYEKVGDGNVSIQYYNEKNEILNNIPKDAGKYTVKTILEEGTNYTGDIAEANFEIKKATYDISNITFEDMEYTYDGSQKEIKLAGELPDGVTVKYENNIAINAGEYQAIASFILADNVNYNSIEDKTAILKINKAKGNIEITNKTELSKIYDGDSVSSLVCKKNGDGIIEVQYFIKTSENIFEMIESNPVDVGTYVVIVTLSETNNYTGDMDDTLFEITKATHDIDHISFEDIEYTYDGAEKKIEISGELPEGVTVEYKNNIATEIGEYIATANFIVGDTKNYNEIESKTATLKIVQADGTIIIKNKEELNKVYDGKPIVTPIYQKNGDGEVTIEYYKKNNIYNKIDTIPVDAGTYLVKVILSKTENYDESSDQAIFTIEKATYDMSNINFEDVEYVYDGTEKKIEVSGELPEGITVEYENNTATDIGEYSAIAKFVLNDDLNYNSIPDKTAVLKISKAKGNIEIINEKELSKIYDGNPIVEPIYEKVGDGEVIVEYYNGEKAEGEALKLAPTDAGIYTVKVRLEGSNNYTGATAEARFEISKATYDMNNISFEDVEYIYDGTEKEIEITGQLPNGVTIEYENNIAINAGEYEAIANFIVKDTVNYNQIDSKKAILKIGKAEGKIKITSKLGKIYDGKSVAEPTYEKIGDGNVIIEYYNEKNEILNHEPVNAGKYKVKLIQEESNNHKSSSIESTFEIEKATYDMSNVNFENTEYTYDGEEKRIEISGNLPEGVIIEYENNIAINAGEYEAIAKFTLEDRVNYNPIEDKTAILKINKAKGKIEITNQLGKIYDENPVEEPTYNKIGDGNVIIEYSNLDEEEGKVLDLQPINVGRYLVKVILEDGNNYEGNFAQSIFEIEKATYDMSNVNFENVEYIYDGTEKEIKIAGQLPNGVTVEYENNLATNVGEYEAIAKFIIADEENYNLIDNQKAKLIIKKATYDISNINFEDSIYVYDGTEKKIEISGQLPKGVTVEYENNIAIDTGEYEAVARFIVEDLSNYNEIEDMKAILKISKTQGDILITKTQELNKVYDGNQVQEPTYLKIGEGNIEIEYYEGENTEGTKLSSPPIDAGIYTVKVILTETKNHKEATDEATFEIEKATYDMSNISFEDVQYTFDGIEKKVELLGKLPEGVTVQYENNTAIDVGTYRAIARFLIPDTKNYNSINDMSADLEIIKANGKIEITNKDTLNKIYDGNTINEIIYEKTGEGNVKIEYYKGEKLEGEKLTASPVNAGTYLVKVIMEESKNYTEAWTYTIFEIKKATYDMTNISFEDIEYEYSGSKKTVKIKGKLPEGVTVQYENNMAIDVGEYQATARFVVLDTNNYNQIEDMTAKLRIVQAKGNIVINKQLLDKVYDGEEKINLIYQRTGKGQVDIEYYEGENTEGKKLNTIPVNVGKYTVKLILEETKNYSNAFAEATFEIKKATYDMSRINFSNIVYEYDGTEKKIEISGDIPKGVIVNYENNTAIKVGEYEAIAKFTNPDTKNYYDIEDMKATLKIEKGTYDISNINFSDVKEVYDGTEKKVELFGKLPEGVTVQYENNTATDVGTYIAVAKFNIPNSDNYNQIPDMKARLKIVQAQGNITITNKEELSKIYDGKAVQAPIYEKTEEGNVRIEYYGETLPKERTMNSAPVNAGKYTVRVVLEESKNYTGATADATFEITKATYDLNHITFEDTEYEYDGQEKKIEISGELPEGLTVEYENNTATEIGEYTATAKFINSDTTNYKDINNMSATLKIIQKPGTVLITNKLNLGKTYDGKAINRPTYNIAGEGNARIEYYEGSKAEGTPMETAPVDAGIYTAKVILSETENYPESFDEVTFEIAKSTYDMSNISFEDVSYIYDGTQKGIHIKGDLPEGVTVEYENNIGVNVGEYEAKAKFKINDSKNYNQIEDMTATLKIEQAEGKIAITNGESLNKTYDGNAINEVIYEKTGEANVIVEYYTGQKAEGEKLTATPINAGIYTVKLILEESDNYTTASTDATFEISKATYDISNIIFKDITYKYDGTEKKIEITGQLPEGVTVEYENNTGVEVGEYHAIANFIIKDAQNYNNIESMTAKLFIVEDSKIDFGDLNIIEQDGINYMAYIDAGTTINQLTEKISETITIYKDDELIENTEEIIQTGMKIVININENIYEYQTVVRGDITGDGKVTDSDLLMLARYMVGCEKEIELVKGARLLASDVYEDGQNATDKDLLKLARILLK